jgi:hypothetical protein
MDLTLKILQLVHAKTSIKEMSYQPYHIHNQKKIMLSRMIKTTGKGTMKLTSKYKIQKILTTNTFIIIFYLPTHCGLLTSQDKLS